MFVVVAGHTTWPMEAPFSGTQTEKWSDTALATEKDVERLTGETG